MLQTIRPFRLFEKMTGNREVLYHIPEVSGSISETIRSIETLLLIATIRILEASTVLELGTAYGYNALHLAMNTEAVITTVDLKQRPDPAWKRTSVEKKICPIERDIYDTAFSAQADLVFCDINYSYDSVKRSTEIAFQASPKAVAWHDFRNPQEPHTERFLDEIAATRNLFHIDDTWIVFWFADANLL